MSRSVLRLLGQWTRALDHVADRPLELHPLSAGAFAALAAGVTAVVVATRLPFATQTLFSWDAANYALALSYYNVAFHQPHPPGNPLYVAAAWLVNHLTADANRSYVLLSIMANAAAAVALLGLGWRLLGRLPALIAVALFLSSPTVWGHGEVAYPYGFLALFTALVGWCAVETRWGRRDLTLAGAVALAMGAGFRPDLLLWLGPAWAFGSLRRLRSLMVGSLVVIAIVLAWAIPMAQLSGGWQTYLEIMRLYEEYWGPPPFPSIAFFESTLNNAGTLLGYTVSAFGPVLLPIAYGLLRWLALGRPTPGPAVAFLWLLTIPPTIFYILVHIGNPGYVLSFTPPAVLFAARGTGHLGVDLAVTLRWLGPRAWSGPRVAVSLALAIATVNSALFLFADGETRLTHLRSEDRRIQAALDLVHAGGRSRSTLVIAGDSRRQLEYYLPEHRSKDGLLALWLSAEAKELTAQHELVIPQGISRVVVMDLEAEWVRPSPRIRRVPISSGDYGWEVSVRRGETLTYGGRHLSLATGAPPR